MEAVLKLLILPKSIVSYLTGFLARLYIPGLSRFINAAFVKCFSIDMTEAEFPSSHYKTVEDIFTRALQPGLRPLGVEPLSPADGKLSKSLPIKNGVAIQAKGQDFSVRELVFGDERNRHHSASSQTSNDFLNSPAWFSTVYLAPHNYHRVHSPVSGQLTSIRYIPGELWPVNQPAVKYVPKLFCRNERLVFCIESETMTVHAVMVGALNVARMTTPHWKDLVTHEEVKMFTGSIVCRNGLSINIAAGDELGTFALGSTVVMVFEGEGVSKIDFTEVNTPRPILMGHTLVDK